MSLAYCEIIMEYALRKCKNIVAQQYRGERKKLPFFLLQPARICIFALNEK